MDDRVVISALTPDDGELAQLNEVVEGAVLGWDLADRVKRLALPSYRYRASDRGHLGFAVAREAPAGRILGVAAWEPAAREDCPPGRTGLLLHGLFVAPAHQRRGIGRRLLRTVSDEAVDAGFDGLLVKAQRDAEKFFLAHGFAALPEGQGRARYAHRLWRAAGG